MPYDNNSSTLNSIVEMTHKEDRNAILLQVGDFEWMISSKKRRKERTEHNLESKKNINRLQKNNGRFALIKLESKSFINSNYSSYTIETPGFLYLDVGRSVQKNIHLLEFGVSMGNNCRGRMLG